MLRRLGKPAVLIPLLLTAGLLAAPGTATAEEPRGPGGAATEAAGKTLRITVPRGYAGQSVRIGVTLRAADGSADPGRTVRLQRYDGRRWTGVGSVTTGDDGRASSPVELGRRHERNQFRALHDTASRTITARRDVLVKQRSSTVRLSGPANVQDGARATLRVRWLTGTDEAVGGRVALQRATGDRWTTVRTLRTDREGAASYTLRPTGVTRWRAVGAAQSWVRGDSSDVLRVRSVPPGDPVRLPAGAPRPRRSLPDQARAVGSGANASAGRIGDAVWRTMVGRSWRAGCPVGRGGLRLVRTNYWDFGGYRRRGEIVVNAAIAGKTVRVMRALYAARVPIRHMYRVDRFGYSRRVNGADDYASMAADNTSAFNCRDVVGSPGRRSPHSLGRSIDINPWENPYRSAQGWTPNTWWVGKSHPRVAWRSRSHRVVRIFNDHGFRWTYGTFDAHHFDGRSAAEAERRPLACDGGVCH